MSKRMTLLVLFVIALAVGLVLYQRHRTYTHFNGGEVTAAGPLNRPLSDPSNTPTKPSTSRVSAKPSAAQPLNDPPTALPGSSEVEDAGDSLPANPPEHAMFSGTGRFQVYRQGNLTWRLDTDSGTTCVLFATDEEWRKPRVYNRACANN